MCIRDSPNINLPRYGWPTNALDRIIRKAWTDLPEGYCRFYVNPAQPCTCLLYTSRCV